MFDSSDGVVSMIDSDSDVASSYFKSSSDDDDSNMFGQDDSDDGSSHYYNLPISILQSCQILT